MINEILHKIRRHFDRKLCLAPEKFKNECSRTKPPKCHTIARSSALKAISHNGHVYVIRPNKNNFYEKIGIKNASVFYGFCKHHDNALFRKIENNNNISDIEQYFLIGYRALCIRLYLKQSSSTMPVVDVPYFSEYIDGAKIACDDLEHYKRIYDEILVRQNYKNISAAVFLLEQTPPVMGNGFFFPEKNLKSEVLNDLGNPDIIPLGFSISCLGTADGKGVIVCTAPEYSKDVLQDFYLSIVQLNEEKIFEVFVKILFIFEENIAFSPTWWDGLSEQHKNLVQMMFHLNISPFSYDPVSNESVMLTHHGFFDGVKIHSSNFIKSAF